jgi:hypothetical protein
MPLFTVILEYKGGTYIRQARANTGKPALMKALHSFEFLTERARQKLAEKIKDDDLTPIEGMKGVWCACGSTTRGFALMHIVATAA